MLVTLPLGALFRVIRVFRGRKNPSCRFSVISVCSVVHVVSFSRILATLVSLFLCCKLDGDGLFFCHGYLLLDGEWRGAVCSAIKPYRVGGLAFSRYTIGS